MGVTAPVATNIDILFTFHGHILKIRDNGHQQSVTWNIRYTGTKLGQMPAYTVLEPRVH